MSLPRLLAKSISQYQKVLYEKRHTKKTGARFCHPRDMTGCLCFKVMLHWSICSDDFS